MSTQLYPARCPLDGTLLEEVASPAYPGMRRRECPVVTCTYATPSYKPERKHRGRGQRRRPVGAGRSSWRRDDHWKDRDER